MTDAPCNSHPGRVAEMREIVAVEIADADLN